jgi:DNA-binding response OmpR family regulator
MAAAGPLKNYKILIVDDDPDLQEYLRAGLDPYFSLVMMATTAAEAKSVIGGLCRFDAIICDFQLPDSDGLKIYQWVREEKEMATPFLMISGYDPLLPEGDPAFDFLGKPFHPQQLIAQIKNLLDQASRRASASAG